jgi:hypothetical protein
VFDPAAKCCTYLPTLPNFLVGMVLSGDDAAAIAGRAIIERRIAEGTGVTPLGLQADPHFAVIHKHAAGDSFGRSLGLRCPQYLPAAGGQCGIWRHRNAVCCIWFCNFERGRVGERFCDALLQLLTMGERHLGLWAARELGEPIAGLGLALLPYYATALPGRDAALVAATAQSEPSGTVSSAELAPGASRMPTEEGIRVPSVLRCGLWLFAIKVALKTRGFGWTIRLIRRHVEPIPGTISTAVEAVLATEHAVALAGALYPGRALCLEQSILLYYLLRRQGVRVTFAMGVQPHPFLAHAWVEYCGKPINDVAEHVKHFTRMPGDLS